MILHILASTFLVKLQEVFNYHLLQFCIDRSFTMNVYVQFLETEWGHRLDRYESFLPPNVYQEFLQAKRKSKLEESWGLFCTSALGDMAGDSTFFGLLHVPASIVRQYSTVYQGQEPFPTFYQSMTVRDSMEKLFLPVGGF